LEWIDIHEREILYAYAEIDHWSRTKGIRMGKNDLWIAATAKAASMTILTTDKDFDHLHPTDPSRSWRVDRVWIDPDMELPPK
jgi:predicted nuclease of predicted toxin-antitoxin system